MPYMYAGLCNPLGTLPLAVQQDYVKPRVENPSQMILAFFLEDLRLINVGFNFDHPLIFYINLIFFQKVDMISACLV